MLVLCNLCTAPQMVPERNNPSRPGTHWSLVSQNLGDDKLIIEGLRHQSKLAQLWTTKHKVTNCQITEDPSLMFSIDERPWERGWDRKLNGFNFFYETTIRHRPHYSWGIWERKFHSENSSNVFRPRDLSLRRTRNLLWASEFPSAMQGNTTPEEF